MIIIECDLVKRSSSHRELSLSLTEPFSGELKGAGARSL